MKKILQKCKISKTNNKNAENRLTLYIYIYNGFIDLIEKNEKSVEVTYEEKEDI